MSLKPRGDYPKQRIEIETFESDLSILSRPAGLVEANWPPMQVAYLGAYLQRLGCKTIVVEHHYIDRDYIHDHALLYSRSLRSYPNYCYRLHFFGERFDGARWWGLVREANRGSFTAAETFLQTSYLGFSVIRPLSGSPIGRTVVPTLEETTPSGMRRLFPTVREYTVHLAGFSLHIRGLAFQQQDQGVSACATAALWSTMHCTCALEGLPIPTPAEITQAASRYLLVEGRALPSEGLTVQQICEATRAAGLAPLVVRSTAADHDRAQLATYLGSGFPVILALLNLAHRHDGHAICAIGMKLGQVAPRTNPNLHYQDASSGLVSVYAHDDRLGPYASVELFPYTTTEGIGTGVRIKWPEDDIEDDLSLLQAMIIPVPVKLRLTATRMRELGHLVAETLGRAFHSDIGDVILSCRYSSGTEYLHGAFGRGLSVPGIRTMIGSVILSRYIGILEISSAAGALVDILLDTTETRANPAVLACVRRRVLNSRDSMVLRQFSQLLGGVWIS